MTKILSLPSVPLPSGAQALIRPMLFAALGLHAFLLFVPFPKERKEKPPETKEAPVKITQLATTKGPSASKPLPKVPTTKVKPALPKISRPATTTAAAPVPKAPETKEPPAPPVPITQPPKGQQVDRPSETGEVSDLLKEFPVYAGARGNCFDRGFPYCYVASAGLGPVADFYEKAVPAKKIQIQSLGGDAEKRLYKVSKGNDVQYLGIFADGTETVISLTREPITSLDVLKNAVSIPPAYSRELGFVFGDSGRGEGEESSANRPELYTNPELYFKEIGGADATGFVLAAETRDEVAGALYAPAMTPDAAFSDLRARFASKNLQVSEVGSYGGGKVYQIQEGSATVFLNLIPSKDGTGTIAVTWTVKPG
jgi:hypothetical protein